MFQHMLVPLDGSPQAERMLPALVWLANRLPIPLTLLSVLDTQASPSPALLEAEGAQRLQGLAAQLTREGVRATAMVAAGRPVETILRVAEQQGCNLITLSMSTHHPQGQGLLGGVTDRIFHRSDMPLLLMPPQPSTPPEGLEGTIASLIVPLDGSP